MLRELFKNHSQEQNIRKTDQNKRNPDSINGVEDMLDLMFNGPE
jgi:hypothetical protein